MQMYAYDPVKILASSRKKIPQIETMKNYFNHLGYRGN